MAGSGVVEVPVAEATAMGRRAVRALGAPESTARLVVDRLVDAELDGYPSHGLVRVTEYQRAVARGQLVATAAPSTTRVSDTVFTVDGHRAFGAVVAEEVAAVASDPVSQRAPVLIGVRASGHLGRLAHLGRAVAASGRVILGFVNSGGGAQKVVPFGGAEGRLATNPILFACPSPSGDPVVVDVSTAAASDGSVQVAAARGVDLPDGVLVDRAGRWVRDPARLNTVPRTAFLAPLGGAKGFALAVAVEILAGVLAGPGFVSPGNPSMGNCGLFLVFGIGALGRNRDDVLADLGQLEEYLLGCPARDGHRVRLPGRGPRLDRPAAVPIAASVWRDIQNLADRYVPEGNPTS